MTTTLTIETDDPAEIAKIACALAGETASTTTTGGGAGGGTTGSMTGTTSTPAAKNYFPADPGTAPFPSPEGSMISVVNGKVYLYDSFADVSVQNDNAYLRDATGGIVTFKSPLTMQGALYASDGSQVPVVLINGTQPVPWFAGDQVAICGGVAWVHETGKWFFISPGTSGSGGNVLDLVYQPAKGKQYEPGSASSPGTTTPAMPTAPAAVSPAPGSSANVIKAGPTQTIKTLADAVAAANNGDTIQLDPGTYAESVAITKAVKVTSAGVTANPGTAGATWSGGAKIDATGVALAHGLGALVPMTDCIFEGLEITGAGLQETVGGGTAGIRNGAPANVVVRNCYIHDNQDGCFSGGFESTWTLENNLLLNNGIGDGQTHNVYFSDQVVNATFTNNTSANGPAAASALRASGMSNGGHAYKSRANVTTFNGGYGYAADATVIDLPDGSTQTVDIKGMSIEKKAGDSNHGVIGYASESQIQGAVGVIVSGCGFVLNVDSPFMQCLAGPMMFDSACTWQGNKPTANGAGTITGLPA